MDNSRLQKLSWLIRERNQIDAEIAGIIGYPALSGHIGEYIAAGILGIALEESAAHKSSDGKFTEGSLAGRTVHIKWSAKHDGLLNLTPDDLPEYYLVMTGPKTGPVPSRGTSRPWCIAFVFLFNALDLVATLKHRGAKLGIATSIIKRLWDAAEIYPNPRNVDLVLSHAQRKLLALFDLSLVTGLEKGGL